MMNAFKTTEKGLFSLIQRTIFFFLVVCPLATAQEFPKSAFGILNLIPRPTIIKISLGSNLLTPGDEEINPGFYSGMMPWRPEKEPLKAEAAGYQSAELKPFLKATETPVIILQENPAKTLKLTVLPNAKERSPAFFDAINLTSQESLQIEANGKSCSLPNNKRIRLTKEKKFSFTIPGKPEKTIDPEDPCGFLLIFYTRPDGTVDCAVTLDNLL
jgi:hypothetical protein